MPDAPAVLSVQGPWKRVVDTARAGQSDPESLRDLVDGVILPTGAVASRPGSRTLATHPGAPGETQALEGLELAGTRYTLAVVGGVLARYDWATDMWTTLAHAGATINVTGPVWLGGFFDQLVVSDGVNRAWATTIGSGTATSLPVSAPFAGPLAVKDARLFGVFATDHRTVAWSEEADLAIGWDTAGYNNAWDLRQTSQAAVTAIRASNQSLVYLRPTSAGQILGAVNAEYQASGSHDDVAAEFGTESPGAVVLSDAGALWAVSREGRPYRVRAGSAVDRLYLLADATTIDVRRDRLVRALALYDPEMDAVGFALPREAASPDNTDLLWFDATTGDYVGRWRNPSGGIQAAARCTDDDGTARLVVLNAAGTPTVYWTAGEAEADAAKAVDVTARGAALVPTRLIPAEAEAEGADQYARVSWLELVVETGDPFGNARGTLPPHLAVRSGGVSLGYDLARPGRDFSGTPRVVTVGASGRKAVGLDRNRMGRWVRAALTAAVGAGTERFRVWRVTFRGALRDAAPKSR